MRGQKMFYIKTLFCNESDVRQSHMYRACGGGIGWVIYWQRHRRQYYYKYIIPTLTLLYDCDLFSCRNDLYMLYVVCG